MSALPGVNAELAAAVRRINSLYGRIPETLRPDVDGSRWRELEAEIDECCAAGDRAGALDAIARWESFASRELARELEATAPRPNPRCNPHNRGEAG